MNTQGNIYTFVYASVMVVVVAAALALVSEGLKPVQERNEMVAKKIDILQAVNVDASAQDAEGKFEKIIGDASYIINFNGERVEGAAFDVDLAEELRKAPEERLYPVYEARLENGELKYVLQFRGKGLWGPLWGFMAINADGNTIYGAIFDHRAETPGLGAEINQTPFEQQFKGKSIFDQAGNLVGVEVVKGGAPEGSLHAVDGISGGTITSDGLEAMIIDFLSGYEIFLRNIKKATHE